MSPVRIGGRRNNSRIMVLIKIPTIVTIGYSLLLSAQLCAYLLGGRLGGTFRCFPCRFWIYIYNQKHLGRNGWIKLLIWWNCQALIGGWGEPALCPSRRSGRSWRSLRCFPCTFWIFLLGGHHLRSCLSDLYWWMRNSSVPISGRSSARSILMVVKGGENRLYGDTAGPNFGPKYLEIQSLNTN